MTKAAGSMNRCPQCGLALVDVTGMAGAGRPVYEEHLACGCQSRLWALDKRSGRLTIREEGTPPA